MSAQIKFLKICRSESMLNCRFRQSRIKFTHTTWVVWEARPYFWLKGCNGQLSVYVLSIVVDNKVAISVKLKGRSIIPVTFKIKFLFELAILYIIFNMATSNIKRSPSLPTCLIGQYCRFCYILEKVNFISSADCNNENKLKVTLKFTLTKVTFN